MVVSTAEMVVAMVGALVVMVVVISVVTGEEISVEEETLAEEDSSQSKGFKSSLVFDHEIMYLYEEV